MKNVILFLFVILFISACSSQNSDSSNNYDNFSSNANIIEENNDYENEYEKEDINLFYNNSELIGEIEDYKIFKIGYTHNTKAKLVLENNVPNLKEVPNQKFCIIDNDGNVLINHSFDYCELFSPINRYSHPEYYTLSGSANGNLYKYIFKDGTFEKYIFESAGENGTEFFGYKLTQYCWYNEYFNYGINDPEGNVLFEPIYTRIEMPFEDRFILGEGSQGMFNSQGEGRYLIADTKGNILAMYSYITYKIFDDGSYLGIASVAGGNSVKCYNEDGNILAEGYYFVDRDGKRLSQRFESLSINGGNIFAISSKNEMITAIIENGKETVFSVNDYICGI